MTTQNKRFDVIIWDNIQKNFNIKLVKDNKKKTGSAFLIYKKVPGFEYDLFRGAGFCLDRNKISLEDVVLGIISDNTLMQDILPMMQEELNEYINKSQLVH